MFRLTLMCLGVASIGGTLRSKQHPTNDSDSPRKNEGTEENDEEPTIPPRSNPAMERKNSWNVVPEESKGDGQRHERIHVSSEVFELNDHVISRRMDSNRIDDEEAKED